MIQPINDGGPAYPTATLAQKTEGGMTLRQYAAIKLCVPDSGLPWLDEMIVKSNRERLAAAALQGMLTDPQREGLADDYAKHAYICADATLKAGEAK
jgi:hypothetical protein